ATNEDVRALVAEGKFRADLYYRMGQLVVRMPALAGHSEDIPTLLKHLLIVKAEQSGIPAPALTPADLERLMGYSWPGNVRELAAVAEQILVFGRLPESFAHRPITRNWRDQIPDTLSRCGGNRAAAARLLGVSRQSLHRALQ